MISSSVTWYNFNREASYVNKMLDNCKYPDLKLVEDILSEKHLM